LHEITARSCHANQADAQAVNRTQGYAHVLTLLSLVAGYVHQAAALQRADQEQQQLQQQLAQVNAENKKLTQQLREAQFRVSGSAACCSGVPLKPRTGLLVLHVTLAYTW
jgi:septal ring factor EnvC (AmiA/AmiB activator)